MNKSMMAKELAKITTACNELLRQRQATDRLLATLLTENSLFKTQKSLYENLYNDICTRLGIKNDLLGYVKALCSQLSTAERQRDIAIEKLELAEQDAAYLRVKAQVPYGLCAELTALQKRQKAARAGPLMQAVGGMLDFLWRPVGLQGHASWVGTDNIKGGKFVSLAHDLLKAYEKVENQT